MGISSAKYSSAAGFRPLRHFERRKRSTFSSNGRSVLHIALWLIFFDGPLRNRRAQSSAVIFRSIRFDSVDEGRLRLDLGFRYRAIRPCLEVLRHRLARSLWSSRTKVGTPRSISHSARRPMTESVQIIFQRISAGTRGRVVSRPSAVTGSTTRLGTHT